MRLASGTWSRKARGLPGFEAFVVEGLHLEDSFFVVSVGLPCYIFLRVLKTQ